ncbi:biotin-dependent carboxyltransferase family protein [Actinomycetospora lutea]|uniref:5-oxoprolinase subunit C family protein n=1 Tax=Actinomycetospora lutea TaxID=663604 RepID=UPI002365520B|nr:biotin-dependent carboxyltransferase family protein [Actinomycetospora lutea]MDD7940650.1 biotin-dependent carboxyltransferase family protein [Actinomycetospora lutea]
MTRELVVEEVGPQALVVDRGRPGWAHIGVPPAGALDGPAHALAQRLVGNPPEAAGLEILLGGLALRVTGAATLALTGPPGGLRVRRAGAPERVAASHQAVHVAAGDVVVVPAPATGLRGYLAVGGGVAVAAVLGSRSADTLSGLGPAPLEVGTRLPVGPPTAIPPHGTGAVGVSVAPDAVRVRLHLGPRADWIDDAADRLRTGTWTVAPTGDRVGVRLEGPALERADARRGEELRSEGLVGGAVQVPPDGQPVVFLADHPTTGGYPVVGVVDPAELAAFAQLRPGSSVRFSPVATPPPA